MGIIITAGSGMMVVFLAIGVIDGLFRAKDATLEKYPLRAVAVIFPFAVLALDPWLSTSLLITVLRGAGATMFLVIIIAVVRAWKEQKRTVSTHVVWTVICGVAGFGSGWLFYRMLLL